MSTKVLLIFLFFSYFLIQTFLFFLFSESRVSYFPIFLSDQAAGHPEGVKVGGILTVKLNLEKRLRDHVFWYNQFSLNWSQLFY